MSGVKLQTQSYSTTPTYRDRQLTGLRVRQSLRLESADAAGNASGTLKVPVGDARLFTVEAFDLGANSIRVADEVFHFEPPSTRTLVTAARMIAAGASELEAVVQETERPATRSKASATFAASSSGEKGLARKATSP